MKTYGTIKYSTVDAKKPFTGICESFNYKITDQIYEHTGEDASVVAMVPHGRKGELTFSASPAATVTALGVRAGAELTITGISTGKIIVMQSSAKWQRGQAMVFDASATHYAGISTGTGSITPATITLDKGTQPLQLPTDKIWFGVAGLEAPVAGIVQSCSINESVQAQEEEDENGEIVAVAIHGYKATAQMEILTDGAMPEVGTDLEAFGTFRITSAEEKWSKGGVRSISVEGVIVPAA